MTGEGHRSLQGICGCAQSVWYAALQADWEADFSMRVREFGTAKRRIRRLMIPLSHALDKASQQARLQTPTNLNDPTESAFRPFGDCYV